MAATNVNYGFYVVNLAADIVFLLELAGSSPANVVIGAHSAPQLPEH
jgi:hypothetical protein